MTSQKIPFRRKRGKLDVRARSASLISVDRMRVERNRNNRFFGQTVGTGACRYHYWWMVDKVRARDGQCKLAPDLEPSPFYTKPSRPCAKDDDGVEKYNILRTCKRRWVYIACIGLCVYKQPANQY